MKAQHTNKTYGNIVNRQINQGKAKKVILTDISYITYGNGKRVYLSVMKDATTKMILALEISLTLELQFVLDTVNRLIDFYGKELDINIIIHSDQGVHYTSIAYQQLLKDNNILQSMSRKGECLDNSPMENFFCRMKNEMFYGYEYEFKTLEELKIAMEEYIDYYNTQRITMKLKELTPVQYRNQSL